MTDEKTRPMMIRPPVAMFERIKTEAKKQGRTRNNYVVWILQTHFKGS